MDDSTRLSFMDKAFGSGQTAKHLDPMVDGAKANLEKIGQSADYFKGKILTADTNYHNQSNLKKCHNEQLDAYIPDLKFRNHDSRFATRPRNKPKKSKKFVLEDFKHNQAADRYICPNGKVLKLNIKRHTTDRNIYRRYMADETDCSRCSLTHRCFYRAKIQNVVHWMFPSVQQTPIFPKPCSTKLIVRRDAKYIHSALPLWSRFLPILKPKSA